MSTWIYEQTTDPLKYAGFIYKITLSDGRYYVGKKFLWVMSKQKIKKESDWRTYKSSSKDLKALLKTDPNATFEIIQFSESRGKCGYLEEKYLWVNDCMLDSKCLNGNIGMKFNRKVVQGWHNDERCEKYLKDIAKMKKEAGLNEDDQ